MGGGSAELAGIEPPETMEIKGRQDVHLRLAQQDEIAPLFEATFSEETAVSRRQKVDEAVEGGANGTRVQYQIIVDSQGEAAVAGAVVLYDKNTDEATAGLSYYVGKAFRGHGYVTDAAKQIIEFGFEEWGLDRIFLEINAGNAKSEAVAARIGAVLTDKTSEDVVGGHKFPYRIWEINKS